MNTINFVKEIDEGEIKLQINEKSICNALKQIGGKKKILSKEWIVSFSDKTEQLVLLEKLIKLGVAFEGGAHGWPPSQQLAQFRDDGHLLGTWKEVVWGSQDKPIIRVK